MQHAQFREDVKVVEVLGILIFSKWIARRRFGQVLSSRIFIEEFVTVEVSIIDESAQSPSNARKASMRRDEFQK